VLRFSSLFFAVFFLFLIGISPFLHANEKNTSVVCRGNIEAFDKSIIQAGVSYDLSYSLAKDSARVWFAGYEFDAFIEEGKSWKGLWTKKTDNKFYFSFLPNEGGSIKFMLEPDKWFSGNCQ
jgi:hypothetical protein